MFILDTNILIYYISGEKKAGDFILGALANNTDLAVAAISVLEFMSYGEIAVKDKETFLLLMEQVSVVSLDFDQALLAAKIRLNYKLRLADSAIAASAMVNDAILVSRDQGFNKIKEIEVMDL